MLMTTFAGFFVAAMILTTNTNNANMIMNCNAFQIKASLKSINPKIRHQHHYHHHHHRPDLLSMSLLPKLNKSTSTSISLTSVSTPSSSSLSTTTTMTSTSLFATPPTTTSSSNPIETNDEAKDPNTLISAKDATTQQIAFVAICSGIVGGSFLFIELYNYLEMVLPTQIFTPFYTILPYVLSTAFIAAGISHFALESTFTSFVPPKGSWGGLWNVPSPFAEKLGLTYEQYHSFWTGIAEVVVGSSLIITTSGILGVSESNSWTNTPTIPSLFMYLLTLAVTPANVYMYTHNPVVPRIPVLPYPYGHVGRGLLQCALLGVFYKLTVHSYMSM